MLVHALQTKMDEILCQKMLDDSLDKQLQTVELASFVSTTRCYSDFITEVKKRLPQFMGFDAVGILFRDTRTNLLFTVDRQYTTQELDDIDTFALMRQQGIQLSKEHRVKEFERQMKRGIVS